ncbi:hypothetical protein [Streptacidiphilus cavernicola]|uniref:Uncharacterized protein n=1 Tax=Streptacidiphilus cavernicola TaxID=3342716 RepID=A0ABV6W4F7_9ACTN
MAPDRVGAGRAKGALKDRDLPVLVVIVASGPEPPADSTSEDTAAFGEIPPPAFAASVASTGVQEPSFWTRWGCASLVSVKVPSGLATVVLNIVVIEGTGTLVPVAFACASAC